MSRAHQFTAILCAAACVAQATPKPAPSTTSIGELRKAAHGRPILVSRNDRGEVVASTEDHVLTMTLATGLDPIHELYDPERELLWYVAHETLWVLDLRANAAPMSIAEHVTTGFVIDGVSSDGDGTRHVSLVWTRAPKLGDSGLSGEMWVDSPEDAAAVARAHLVGTAWLERNVDRAKRAIADRPFDAVNHLDGNVDVEGRGECVGPICGTGAVLGATGLVLVVTESYRDHDGSHRACSLFDPIAHRFVDERGNPKLRIRFSCEGQLDRDTREFLGCGSESDATGFIGGGQFACTREGCTALVRTGACTQRFLDPGARTQPLR